MIFDELVENIKKLSNESIVKDIAQYLINWKSDDRNFYRFKYDFEKYLEAVSIGNILICQKIYEMWVKFKNNVILNLNSMAMDERLYICGLMEKFYTCKDMEVQNNIYKKINIKLAKNLTETTKEMLDKLIKTSRDKRRIDLYKLFLEKLMEAHVNEEMHIINSIGNNFSGLMNYEGIKEDEHSLLVALVDEIKKNI